MGVAQASPDARPAAAPAEVMRAHSPSGREVPSLASWAARAFSTACTVSAEREVMLTVSPEQATATVPKRETQP